MQDIVFYAAANETLGVVRNYANARKMPTPVLTLGVSVCLRMRLFSALDTAEPYPVAAFDDITDWQWRMDGDFDRDTTCKLVADANGISVHCVTDTINGETMDFTEFVIPISNMNTQELAAWLGNEPKRTGLTGELVGYNSEEHAVFVLQIDNFTVRNRVAGLGTPTAVDQEIVTRTTAEHMIRAAVSAMGNTKQDKLTSSNAGSGISIAGDGVISTANVPQSAISGLSASLAAKQDNLTAGYRMELIGGSTVGQKRYFQIETPTGSSITLRAGHTYRINATTGQKTLNVEAMNSNEFGLDGHLELFLANMGYIQTGPNVVLANALEPDAVNNCTIRFHDGLAIISVEDHVAGYIVVNGSTADDGSLAYGLNTSTNEYIAFDASLNGMNVPLAGATANGEKHIVGNGYTSTMLTGKINCTSKTTVANLALSDVGITGGTLTLGDAFIPSGSTVAVSGGGLVIEKVTGAGSASVIDLGGTNVNVSSGATASVSGCMITAGGNFTNGAISTTKATVSFDSVKITGNTANRGGVYINSGYTEFKNCFLSGNANADISAAYGSALLSGGVYDYYKVDHDAEVILAGNVTVGRLMGQYVSSAGRFGSVTIISGATLDLTGNTNETPIAPGGGITFAPGGATVQLGVTSGTVNSSYMMDNVTLPAGAKLTNTAAVDFSGNRVETNNDPPINMSGCTILSGGFTLWKTGMTAISCTFSSCGSSGFHGGAIQGQFEPVNLTSCAFLNNIGNTKDLFINNGCVATISACTFSGEINAYGSTTVINIAGDNTINVIGGSGSCVISSGASINLTGNTNTTPINPGGGITICGGPMNSGTKIIGSAGAATQMREFEDVEIHGTSITNQGIIYGATVTIPDSRIYHVRYTVDGGLSSGSITITGPTVYVLTDEISSLAGLTGVVNI